MCVCVCVGGVSVCGACVHLAEQIEQVSVGVCLSGVCMRVRVRVRVHLAEQVEQVSVECALACKTVHAESEREGG